MQFQQKLYLDDTAIAVKSWQVGWPVEDMGLQQNPAAIDIVGIYSGARAEIGYACQWLAIEPMHQDGKNSSRSGLPVMMVATKAQIERGKAVFAAGRFTQLAPQFGAVHDMAANSIRAA